MWLCRFNVLVLTLVLNMPSVQICRNDGKTDNARLYIDSVLKQALQWFRFEKRLAPVSRVIAKNSIWLLPP